MTTYIIRRLLQAIPTLMGVTLISFFLMQAAPGDPVQLLTFNPDTTAEAQAELRRQLCLDRSVPEQYMIWLVGDVRKGVCQQRGILRGDFGTSFYDKRPVLDMFMERIPATLELTVISLVIGLLIGVPIGAYSAVKRGKWFDNTSRFFAVVFDAIPAFWFALILILVFATNLGWLPVNGRVTLTGDVESIFWDRVQHIILPATVFAVGGIALYSRFMRAETLEVIRSEYVRTAKAKGLSNGRVYFVHALRNALIPIATFLGPAIAGLIGGSVIIERIFGWPGIGRLTFDAIAARDFPLVMASTMIAAVLVIIGNLLSDVLYAIIDPRIRLG